MDKYFLRKLNREINKIKEEKKPISISNGIDKKNNSINILYIDKRHLIC